MTRADVDAWNAYVAGEVARFFQHCEGTTYIWQATPEAERAIARNGGDSERAAFTGPWHIIRKHLTTEFRQWVEEYEGTERITPTEWRARQVAGRAEVAWMDSADYSLGQLEELRRLTAERDAIIVEAARRGATKVSIARAVGLSRQQIHTIVAAAEVAPAEVLAPVTPIRREVAPSAEVAAPDESGEWLQTASGEWVEVF
jgi:hypothetical protein